MIQIDHAHIDNFYSSYVGNNKFIYKHVYMPNPRCGKNSSAEIKNINKINKPKQCYELKDQTKNTMIIRNDTI